MLSLGKIIIILWTTTIMSLYPIVPILFVLAYENSTASQYTEDTEGYISYGADTVQEKTAKSEEVTDTASETAKVYATRTSSFSVIVPKTITLDGTTKQGTYQVAVKGDLSGGQTLTVTSPDSFLLYEQGTTDVKNGVVAEVYGAKTSWTCQEIQADTYDGTGTTTGIINADGISAGSWKGTFDLTICCEQGEPVFLVDGKNFSQKIKSLVNADATYISPDTTITGISLTTEAPDDSQTTVDLFSDSNEDNYAIGYLDGSVVKIYTNLKQIVCNADSSFMFNNFQKLTDIDISQFNFSKATSTPFLFYNCKSLSSVDVKSMDTSKLTNMSGMFAYSGLTELDFDDFDTSGVTDMDGMFCGCTKLTALDLRSFDTSEAVDINGMFSYCTNLKELDLSSFNVEKVENFYGMFGGCSSLTTLDLSSFHTKNATDMQYMFESCSKLQVLDLGPDFTMENNPAVTGIFQNISSSVAIYASIDTASYLNSKQTLRSVTAKY